MRFESYHLADNASIISTKVPGRNSSKLLEEQDFLEGNNRSYPRGIPLAFERAKGSVIEDVDGNRYIDFFSGCGVLNIGHNNQDILVDIYKQQEKLIHALDFPTRIKIDFMKELHSTLPVHLHGKVRFNFCGPTGADAVEVALKLARMNSGCHQIISFQGAFHGMTAGALSVTAHLHHKKRLHSLGSAACFMPFCYCYRCSFGKHMESCKLECAKFIRRALENPCSGIEKPAAIIVEPVQSEAGTIVPKEGFIEEIGRIAQDFDILLIFDEIQSGFYRTGPFFSFENFGKVDPDIITISKGLGGVGLPIAITIFKKELDTWEKGTHSGTFRGNQLSMSASLSALKFAKLHNIESYTKEMGLEILENLQSLQRRSKYIGDARGLGMMFGIEYVENKKSKKPFPAIVAQVRKRCYENGLLVEVGGHYSNVIRFLPPLITTRTIAYHALEIFERVNVEVERDMMESSDIVPINFEKVREKFHVFEKPVAKKVEKSVKN